MSISLIFQRYLLNFVNRAMQCGTNLILQLKHDEGEILNGTRPETRQNMVLLSYTNLPQVQRWDTNTAGRDLVPVFLGSTWLRARATTRLEGAKEPRDEPYNRQQVILNLPSCPAEKSQRHWVPQLPKDSAAHEASQRCYPESDQQTTVTSPGLWQDAKPHHTF